MWFTKLMGECSRKDIFMESIYGEKVYLRPITADDTDNIIKWRNSEAVRPYFIDQKLITKEGHLNWLKNVIEAGKGFQFIVCMKENGEPIGSTFLKNYDKEHNKIEYGMFLGSEDVKGKGIGAEIYQLTLQFAFEVLNVHKVYSRILADNMASRKSCRNAGLNEEGCLKDEVRVNGVYRDLVMMGITNPKHDKD